MSGTSGVRLAVGLVLGLSAGCGSTRSFTPGVIARAADKNPPVTIDNRYGSLAPAAASSWPAPPVPRPVNPSATWPPADAARAGYTEEPAPGLGAGQPTGEPSYRPAVMPTPQPLAQPPVTGTAYYGGGYDRTQPTMTPAPEPGLRRTPTAVGRDLELGPNEMPIDRAVEMARRIETLNGENLRLLGRIRQLEAAAEARETALNEYLRDVQIASDEVVRTRNEIQAVRKELTALKTRVNQMEKDEIETLKMMISAIEKLLQQDNNIKKN